MKFTAPREILLKPLQAIIGVVERRQTMPILANMLLVVKNDQLLVTATDLEVELVASADVDVESEGEITVPGRKLLDICKALPDGVTVSVAVKGDRVQVQAGRSRFNLSSLPAAEFPTVEDIQASQSFSLPREAVERLLEKGERYLRAVATDGHRLALCEVAVPDQNLPAQQVIVPRKGVIELQRLLDGSGDLTIDIGSNHIRIQVDGIRFTSKLIDGRFPEYARVIPQDPPNVLTADRGTLRQALQRAALLSNEKYRGIRLDIKDSGVVIQAHNPEQEEAEEEVEVEYSGEDIEIGFNVNYLLDALAAVESESVKLGLTDNNSSCLVTDLDRDDSKFVVMPMRL